MKQVLNVLCWFLVPIAISIVIGNCSTVEILRKRGIEIKELESGDNLQNLVMGVFHAFRAVFQFCPCSKIVLNQSGEGEFYRTERLK